MPEAHAATQLSSTIGHSLYSSCKPVKLAAAALLPMDGAIAMYARINDPAVRKWPSTPRRSLGPNRRSVLPHIGVCCRSVLLARHLATFNAQVPYTQVLREHRLLVWLARQAWQWERLPVEQQ